MKLYRGEDYGVFTGPNGYYVARIAADGKSYYEALGGSEGWWPWGGGEGWSDEVRQRCNAQAAELDSVADFGAWTPANRAGTPRNLGFEFGPEV